VRNGCMAAQCARAGSAETGRGLGLSLGHHDQRRHPPPVETDQEGHGETIAITRGH
jgi:hypothetical protein